METANRQIQTSNFRNLAQMRHALPQVFSSVQQFFKLFFPLVAAALVVATGPEALRTLTAASSMLLRAMLELCRISLLVLNILGK